MADKMYAWSPILHAAEYEDTAAGRFKMADSVVGIGEEVSAESLGIPEREFQALVDAGSVRSYQYPKELLENPASTESPREWGIRKINEQSGDSPEALAALYAGAYTAPAAEEIASGVAELAPAANVPPPEEATEENSPEGN